MAFAVLVDWFLLLFVTSGKAAFTLFISVWVRVNQRNDLDCLAQALKCKQVSEDTSTKTK